MNEKEARMKVIVEVNGKYSYNSKKTVKVGSDVILPTPIWLRDVKGPTWTGTVTAIKNGQDNTLSDILGKAN